MVLLLLLPGLLILQGMPPSAAILFSIVLLVPAIGYWTFTQ